MKKIIFVFVSAAILVVFILSCSKNFLNTQPKDKISSEATWADGPLSQAFIYGVYSFLGYAGFEEQQLAAYTDEAMFTHTGRNIQIFTQATETPSNLAWTSDTYSWNRMYLAIREANVAIQRLPGSTFEDKVLRDRLLGEAYFLRAYYYQQLLRTYGGIPIIDRPYGLNEDYTIARNTYEECVNFIVDDLDSSALLLNGKALTPGRSNRLAALALKARVLLYAASDIHDATTAKANSSVLNAYPNIELIAYTTGNRQSRWLAAKAAAKLVVDQAQGYKMNLTGPVSATEGRNNIIAISMGGQSAVADPTAAIELLWQRSHSAEYVIEDAWPLGGIHYGINNGPNGYHNWAGNTPIQQLVDDYEMMDGSRFDWNNATHRADPYSNRDPRFYATILYDGAAWKPRPADVIGSDPVSQVQTGYYNQGGGTILNGIDTRESPVENWNGSRTHYYTRKFIDPNPALPDNQSNAQIIPWPFLRYTEAVLNYVEACIATNDEVEARLWLNRIRFRAGMPAITDAGTALVNRYRNERRIEMQYEEQRYYDARRWMIPQTTVGRGIKHVNITATLKAGQTANVPYRYDRTKYDYTYTVVDNTENETRVWHDKMYHRPISRDEVNRNNKLIQNPGY